MNAFVLAGDQGARQQICGVNKAFLMLEGRPLLIHVLAALDQVQSIGRIYVVGPRKEIMAVIERALPEVLFTKKIEVLQQKDSLVENILSAYAHSLPGYRDGIDPRRLPHADEPGLFMPADIPFVTASEIEAFIAGADMERYDYCLGVTPEEALVPFYPQGEKPGIKLAYLYIKDKAYRMNNLHLARPYRIGVGGCVQRMYDHRHQRYFGNRFRIAAEILKSPRWPKGLFYYLLAQAATFSMNAGLSPIASLCRRFLRAESVEREVSAFLQTRFKAVETGIGSAALDVDDEESYRIICRSFKEWQARFARSDAEKSGAVCPFKTVCS